MGIYSCIFLFFFIFVLRIRAILNLMKRQSVKWICLREEPLIYINDRSFVLREAEHPFRNMKDFQKIDWRRIEEIETRLKSDILREAEKNGGNILIHREVGSDDLRPCWEAITAEAVKTSREMYNYLLKEEGYDVLYTRIPTTPQSSMTYRDIDHLLRLFNRIGDVSSCTFVFNCQMGQGRSTLGTTIMALILMHNNPSYFSELEATFFKDQSSVQSKADCPEISKLLRILDNGQVAKRDADIAIEVCGGVFNIRSELSMAIQNLEMARDTQSQEVLSSKVSQSLDRYCFVICFASYLREMGDIRQPKLSFQEYANLNVGIEQFRISLIKGELLRSSSHIALSEIPEIPPLSRRGSVLQEETILKQCYFQPINDSEKLEIISGAPNFTKVGGLKLAAMAQPDEDGIRGVLNVSIKEASKVCWVCFQVEPVIFLQGKPFIVRDRSHPFRCLEEFNLGLSATRLSQISKRLKSDVIQEALGSEDSVVLVHVETANMELKETKYSVTAKNIYTVDELFTNLSEKYPVHYRHIPLIAEEVPNLQIFDELFDVLSEHITDSIFVFNCQMGRGRSTFGMVAAAIYMMRKGLIENFDIFSDEKEPKTPNALEFSARGLQTGDFKGILNLTRILKRGDW